MFNYQENTEFNTLQLHKIKVKEVHAGISQQFIH